MVSQIGHFPTMRLCFQCLIQSISLISMHHELIKCSKVILMLWLHFSKSEILILIIILIWAYQWILINILVFYLLAWSWHVLWFLLLALDGLEWPLLDIIIIWIIIHGEVRFDYWRLLAITHLLTLSTWKWLVNRSQMIALIMKCRRWRAFTFFW